MVSPQHMGDLQQGVRPVLGEGLAAADTVVSIYPLPRFMRTLSSYGILFKKTSWH